MTRDVADAGQVIYRLTYTCWCGALGAKTIRGPRAREQV